MTEQKIKRLYAWVATEPEALLDQLMAVAEGYAKKRLLRTRNELLPVFELVGAGGAHEIVGCPWRSDSDKTLMVAALRQKMRDQGTLAYSFVGEAWMARQTDMWKPDDVLPSDRPDREEIVWAIASDGFHQRFAVWRLRRDSFGRCAALEPAATGIDPGTLAGRFANLLGGSA
jgi:hypothetical protein